MPLKYTYRQFLLLLAVTVVGLGEMFYNVLEDVGMVEVCAIVYSPVVDCPVEFAFDVRLTTGDNSAGKERAKSCI